MQSQILPSRAALVDRIAMQFEYGQSLICLVGNSGLGKSYLAESFITDKYSDFSKAFIQLSAHSKDADIIRQLMEHTFRAPLVDQKLSLTENFFVLNSEQPAEPCLWVLDGARHLSDELITELQNLAARAPNTLYILVTAQAPNLLPNALDIHLEPLSHAESKQLMRMFFSELPPDDDPIFATFISEARGNPSVLLDWQQADQQLDLRANMPSKGKQKHFFIGAFSLIITLCLVAILYNKQLLDMLYIKQGVAEQPSELLPEPTVLEAQAILDEQMSAVQTAQAEVANKESPKNNETDTQAVTAILGALLTSPADSAAIVEDKVKEIDDLEAEFIDVKSLADNEGKSSLIPEVRQDVYQPDASEDTSLEVAQPIPEIQSEQISAAAHDNTWFLSRSDSEWTIQLLAVTDKKVASEFINQHGLANFRVAEVLRNGRTWWFVTLAPYASLEDAKLARAKLTTDLLAAKPFFKQISQIKQQIQQSQ
ncbi:SPOR domain-containing protein [Pseudoalteromonas luteoviolacea]|uniref:SPOR domain-containing protein n=1 Tax=Pseudoalteromonas luteoviolacea TaxID=43657 RepID=UPI001EED17BF|nr:SPOR domain-containing protein [Pseudoalteromonas luteoviolacea]MCF6438548.1 SPOR domain-containing protein [Pseudoalteromonas luteoviolacea]